MRSKPPYFIAAASILSKSGVPRPVAGSQPTVQLYPYGTGPPPREIAFVPLTMSVNASAFYKKTRLFFEFPYVCPDPVLVKWSFLV